LKYHKTKKKRLCKKKGNSIETINGKGKKKQKKRSDIDGQTIFLSQESAPILFK
jgi:hypothetical protein